MASNYSVSLKKLIKEFNLEKVWAPENIEEIRINTNEVNRPGLQLAGFYELFDPSRVQIIGKTEYSYLKNLGAKMYEALDAFLSRKPMVIIITWNLSVDRKFLELAQKYNVPIFRTSEMTSEFVAGLTQTLSVALAKRITRHGVLVEVYGEGVLLYGDSGV
ncbi:MAG: HPr kinase/phosphorylase, partial [Oscillospiraceae bacterium]|nr:HPr kinase/phosphorylase [Oscillospiraceae bacterium]